MSLDADLQALIRTIPDHPKPGIQFRDISTLLLDGPGFAEAIDRLAGLIAGEGTQLVAGARVSDGFFRTLGVAPLIGRDFYEGEDLLEAPHTVMIGRQ